jgi:hypothetical protein
MRLCRELDLVVMAYGGADRTSDCRSYQAAKEGA